MYIVWKSQCPYNVLKFEMKYKKTYKTKLTNYNNYLTDLEEIPPRPVRAVTRMEVAAYQVARGERQPRDDGGDVPPLQLLPQHGDDERQPHDGDVRGAGNRQWPHHRHRQ